MTFGRREQKVVLGIAFLGLVAILHILFFSPQAREYQDSLAAYQTKKDEASQQLFKIRDRRKIEEMKKATVDLTVQFNDAITSLGMTTDPVFLVPRVPEDPAVKLDPTPAPDTPPDEVKRLKREKLAEVQHDMFQKQLDMVIEQLVKLKRFDRRTRGELSSNTDMAFLGDGLGTGWRIQTALPPNVRGGLLIDTLNEVKDTTKLLQSITNPDQKNRQRIYLDSLFTGLGMDVALYKNSNPQASLAAQGPLLPLLHKINFGQLLLEALGNDDRFKREVLYDLLEININFRQAVESAYVGDCYFLYEQLNHLNRLMEIAVDIDGDADKNKQDVLTQIFGVVLEPPSYLRAQAELGPTQPDVASEWVAPDVQLSADVVNFANDPTVTQPNPRILNNPGNDDIGVCIPIRLQFRSNNLNAWKFIYAVLTKFPMAELDQASIIANPSATSTDAGDIFFQVRFLFVPFLYNMNKIEVPKA